MVTRGHSAKIENQRCQLDLRIHPWFPAGHDVAENPLKCNQIKVRGSIKNIHLYIFRNLNFVFSVLICRSSGPVAPTSLNFKSYLSPDLRTAYGRLYGS